MDTGKLILGILFLYAFQVWADPFPDFVRPGARQKYSFEQITALLNTPELVSQFMANNVKWDGAYDRFNDNEYATPKTIYERGIDDCDGHAILQCYFLEKHKFNAFMVGLSVEGPIGHNVCGVRTSENELIVLDNEGKKEGPFNSLAEIASFYIKKGWMLEKGTLRTIKISELPGRVTNHSKPNVEGLMWHFHKYE